jgi:Tfp pilus assembly protein FimT
LDARKPTLVADGFIVLMHLYARSPYCRPRREHGFGLLHVLLLISVMSGLVAVGYLQWRDREMLASSQVQRHTLVQAQQALLAYAAIFNRLPCPAMLPGGAENCADASQQKGWLPSQTLRMAGIDAGAHVGALRYLVSRGGGENDLTLLSDAWRPLEYDEDGKTFFNMRSSGYPTNILTVADLCQRLEVARTTAVTASVAAVNASTARSVVYALAHPGTSDADGDGDSFDGANAMLAPHANHLEDPGRRPSLSTYDDLVLEGSFTSLTRSTPWHWPMTWWLRWRISRRTTLTGPNARWDLLLWRPS